MGLVQTVERNGTHRRGHKPYSRTIGDALTDLAKRDVHSAFIRHELEGRRGKKTR